MTCLERRGCPSELHLAGCPERENPIEQMIRENRGRRRRQDDERVSRNTEIIARTRARPGGRSA